MSQHELKALLDSRADATELEIKQKLHDSLAVLKARYAEVRLRFFR